MVPRSPVSPRFDHGAASTYATTKEGEAVGHVQDGATCRGNEGGHPDPPRWTLEEVRSVVREHRAAMDSQSPEANLQGLGSMTLSQLRTMAAENNVPVPEKATCGL